MYRMYRFHSGDRAYSHWELVSTVGGESVTPGDVDPLACKWVTGDLVSSEFHLVESQIRDGAPMAGILVLSGSTYGRDLSGKLRYKCVPDDPSLPVFLTPYAAKDVGFSKKKVDRFVTFRWKDWNGKHPDCVLVENLGYVTDDEAFYEYQMRRRGLSVAHLSGKKGWKARVAKALSSTSEAEVLDRMGSRWGLEDRTGRRVITVDPEGCRDFDDALGWEAATETVSIYISNVPAWLECLGLWDAVGGLPATVYLPHRAVPMLPVALANDLCSLVAGRRRPVLALDITRSPEGDVSTSYSVCVISVARNYVYEDLDLPDDPVYDGALSTAEAIRGRFPCGQEPFDSHTVVAFYMMLMNSSVGRVLGARKAGISRTHPGSAPTGLAGNVGRIVEGYHGGSARYVPGGSPSDQGHALVAGGVPHYMHVTSPIRRAVDIANMVVLHTQLGLFPHGGAALGYAHRMQSGLAEVNDSMTKISRVQSDCRMLQMCSERPELLSSEHTGRIVDTVCDLSAPGTLHHTVYMEGLNVIYRFRSDQSLELYGSYKFTISAFRDEHTLNRKIRLVLVEPECVLASV
jgi:hypothetical protein